MYYLSVYVKSFKELFLLLLRESVFLKSECKSTNYFSFHQIFSQKSWDFSAFFNTYKDFLEFFLPLHFILYMHTPACMCGRTPASALIILYSYSKTEKKSGFNQKSIIRRIYLSKKNITIRRRILSKKREKLRKTFCQLKKI